MSPEDEMKGTWNFFDKDSDGVITFEEWEEGLSAMGFEGDMQQAFDEVDIDGEPLHLPLLFDEIVHENAAFVRGRGLQYNVTL